MKKDPECLFCKIIKKEIPAQIEYEDDEVLAIRDINPQAPVHFLVLPKRHIGKIEDLSESDAELVGKLIILAKKLAKEKEVEKDSFRLVMNNGALAGQSVFHIHLHLLAGRKLTWPPG